MSSKANIDNIIIIGDLHLYNRSHRYLMSQRYTIESIISKENPDGIIFLGDIFERRKPTPREFLIFKSIVSFCRAKDIDLIILEDAVNIHLEKYSASIDFKKTYNSFFKSRKVELIDIEEDPDTKIKVSNTKLKQRIEHLLFTLPNNLDIINEALFPNTSVRDEKHLINTLIVAIEVKRGLNLNYDTELLAHDMVSSNTFKKDVLNLLIKSGLDSGKHTKKETIEWFETDSIFNTSLNIIYELVTKRVISHRVGYRDYSNFTRVPNQLLALISKGLGLGFTELDIVTAYPKIIYSLFGLDCPVDFYGADRGKNKIKVNTMLNNLHLRSIQAIRMDRHRIVIANREILEEISGVAV